MTNETTASQPKAASIADDAQFQNLLPADLTSFQRKAIVAYLDNRTSATAPSGNRNVVLEEARAACMNMAEGAGRGAYTEACLGCASAIQALKYEAAAPVVQPLAVSPARTALTEAQITAGSNILCDCAEPMPALSDDRVDDLARLANLDGSMVVGSRSDYWRKFARLIESEVAPQPVAAAQAVPEAMVSAAGRALADLGAEACGINKDDNWKVYGNGFIEDARVALKAAGFSIDTTRGA